MKNNFFSSLACAAILSLSACAKAPQARLPEESLVTLEALKPLEGRWETAPDKQGNSDMVKYHFTSGGSVLEEILFPGSDHQMLTVYYQDGGNLVATHYCMLGNQPHLVAHRVDKNSIKFEFAGGSNIDPTKDMHMHEGLLTFIDKDHIRFNWVGYENGKPSRNHNKTLELTRIKEIDSSEKCRQHCKEKGKKCPINHSEKIAKKATAKAAPVKK